MKKILNLSAILLFVFSFNLANGQEATAQEDVMNTAWGKYMTPGEMHEMLSRSNGEWKETLTFWEPGKKESQTYSASCKNEMILGGRYQKSTHSGEIMGMAFEGIGIVGYDNAKKVFQSTWCDNMGTGISFTEGPYDPATKKINMKGKMMDPETGKEMNIRQVFTFVDDNTQKFEMYMTHEGKEFKSMEIEYKR